MRRSLFALVTIIFLYACQKEHSSEQAPRSDGALQNDFGACLSKLVNGTYIASQPLADSNYIEVQVDVVKTGSFLIYTDTVNGYFFRGLGSFMNTGVNTVRLRGSGNPQAAGDNLFTVFYDSSFCTLAVTVLPGGTVPPPAGDHFILTDNSWWSYSSPLGASDTIKRSIAGSATANGITYKILKEKNTTGQAGIDDSLFVRKSGNNYYELNFIDYYSSIYLDNPVIDSILFLKEGLTSGQTWSSKEYAGTVNSVPVKIKYVYTCTDANATVTLNGVAYTNVYQVILKVQLSENGGPYADDITWTNYYAQGIGWIYQKYSDASTSFELPLRYYQVF